MRRARAILVALALTIVLTQSGCGTIFGFGYPHQSSLIYIGTRLDVRGIGNGGGFGSCGVGGWAVALQVVDLPISFALDTILLPFTLVYEIFRPHEPEKTAPTSLK